MASQREVYATVIGVFADALRQMTSVRVAEGSTPHSAAVKRRSAEFVPVLFSENDPVALDLLRAALVVRPETDGGNWMEPGARTLTLAADEGDLVSVTVVGETHLRFHGVDVWYAPLREPAALTRWLSARLPGAR